MRASQWMFTTLKETPSEAQIASHQLMLRAGLIKQLGSGLYSWLPLGLKTLRKVEAIVREEMNNAGALELLMPNIQPAELWQETGRWDTFGGQLLTLTDSQNRQYCYGPTHEEVVTDIIRSCAFSQKHYPFTVYQIQTKFRDEIRPRFGVMRAREFLMKDAYSFHLSSESLQATYDSMYKAYSTIFTRLGLAFRAVEADTGAIGGAVSHEFQVLAETGEDLLFYSSEGDYAANIEKASAMPPKPAKAQESTLEKVETPKLKTIDDVAQFLKVGPQETVKAILVKGTTEPVVALFLRGDDTLNPIKAEHHPQIHSPLTFVDEAILEKEHQLPAGFIGPVGLKLPMIVDDAAAALTLFICGANETDKHYRNAAWFPHAPYKETADLRNVKPGDPSPDGKGILKTCRGIEVGHIFQLGDKYSNAMQLGITNEQGKTQHPLMGCYGIGVSRIVAAAIEQHHDERGICWPKAMAPFDCVIIPIDGARNEKVQSLAEALYQQCQEMGMDVLLDDRKDRPGAKFADADLIGIPHRIVIGPKSVESDTPYEYKRRTEGQAQALGLEALLSTLR